MPIGFWNLFIDTTITCYLVCVCTAFFATSSARRYARQGMRIAASGAWARRLDALPKAWLPIGCCLFGICLPVLLAIFGGVSAVAGITACAPAQFMAFKGLWGGAFGALVCIAVIVRHLGWEDGHHA